MAASMSSMVVSGGTHVYSATHDFVVAAFLISSMERRCVIVSGSF